MVSILLCPLLIYLFVTNVAIEFVSRGGESAMIRVFSTARTLRERRIAEIHFHSRSLLKRAWSSESSRNKEYVGSWVTKRIYRKVHCVYLLSLPSEIDSLQMRYIRHTYGRPERMFTISRIEIIVKLIVKFRLVLFIFSYDNFCGFVKMLEQK